MFEEVEWAVLDADGTLTAVAAARAVSEWADRSILAAAAHWADLHGVLEAARVGLAGCERLVRLGGDGTAGVAEFAAAELGADLGVSA
jgi:hypothetical protein